MTDKSASEFLASLESAYRNTDIDWEALLESVYVTLFSGREGLGIIDIGGHAGRHSVVFQRKLKPAHLLIFEPLPDQRRSLEALFAPHANVTIQGCALGNQRGQSTFVIKKGAPEESGLRQRSFYNDRNNGDIELIPVTIETLGSLTIPFAVDFIKIDTEGGEIDILKGSETLLRRDAPVISVEYGPGGYDAYGYGPESLFQWAETAGYSIFDLCGNRFASLEEWLSCVARFYWDYLLIPNKRLPDLAERLETVRRNASSLLLA